MIVAALLLAGSLGAFQAESIEGWSVHLEDSIDPATAAAVREELRARLHEVATHLPAARVEELRHVELWVHDDFGDRSGVYTNNASRPGDPAPKGCIDILSAKTFLQSQRDVPSRVLHELAHAYHFQVLGTEDQDVQAAFDHAAAEHLYDNVRNWQGRAVARSYAMNNSREYFALVTQAYFLRSGFFPFNRAELAERDPQGLALARKVWEQRPGPQPARVVALHEAPRSCDPTLRGGGDEPRLPSVLAIRNNSDQRLQVWWNSGTGERKRYADLPAHDLLLQRVFSPHVWELRDAAGECLSAFEVGPLGLHLTVEP